MGSIMIEENVVSAAGAHNFADEKMLRYLIREAGFTPQQRDILYKHVHKEHIEDHKEAHIVYEICALCGLKCALCG